jgi:hypothetical protein
MNIEERMEEMISHQRKAVLALACRIVPHLTSEDILQPNDFPELESHPEFRYEEGILAGLLAMQIAVLSELKAEGRA